MDYLAGNVQLVIAIFEKDFHENNYKTKEVPIGHLGDY